MEAIGRHASGQYVWKTNPTTKGGHNPWCGLYLVLDEMEQNQESTELLRQMSSLQETQQSSLENLCSIRRTNRFPNFYGPSSYAWVYHLGPGGSEWGW